MAETMSIEIGVEARLDTARDGRSAKLPHVQHENVCVVCVMLSVEISRAINLVHN